MKGSGHAQMPCAGAAQGDRMQMLEQRLDAMQLLMDQMMKNQQESMPAMRGRR